MEVQMQGQTISFMKHVARYWCLDKWLMSTLLSNQSLMVSLYIFQLIKGLLLLFSLVVHLSQLFEEVGVQSCLLTFSYIL